jgi:hypothetical protein
MKKLLMFVVIVATLESCYTQKENYYTNYPGRFQRKANTQDCGSSIFVKPKFKN